jgi:hypothetical protein
MGLVLVKPAESARGLIRPLLGDDLEYADVILLFLGPLELRGRFLLILLFLRLMTNARFLLFLFIFFCFHRLACDLIPFGLYVQLLVPFPSLRRATTAIPHVSNACVVGFLYFLR